MADVHDSIVRSYNMNRIRNKNTSPEMMVRKHLHVKGFRFTLHKKSLPGKPDIYLKQYKTVILINGCFWHGHSRCKYFVLPKTRSEWWRNKIDRNIENDIKNIKELKKLKLNVIIVWECDLKKDKVDKTITQLIRKIKLQN